MKPRSAHLAVGLLFGSWLLPASPALAVDVPRHVSDRGGLELPDGRFTRPDALVAWTKPPTPERAAALARLAAEADALWVSWDPDTGVPSRILVTGIEAPGVGGSPTEALVFVRAFLARHLELLAPGADASSFEVVADDDSAGMRTVGLRQVVDGVPVIGGQVSFRFKNDRLLAIGSEALPHVQVTSVHATVDPAVARAAARDWIADDVPGTITEVERPVGPWVLPLVDSGGARYRTVMAVQVHVEGPPSRWTVYVDADTAEPVAREQTLSFASAAVAYNVPVRGPLGERQNRPAPWAIVLDGAQALLTDAFGGIDFSNAPSLLELTATGMFVDVQNLAGPPAIESFLVEDGGTAVWDERNVELVDAQLSAFIHASIVKERVRSIAPDLPWLEQQLPVRVNIEDECNAFSDGNSINFYQASPACENTARLADVVYHEFGHSVHIQSLIQGVGYFDRALSEGIADYLSATITDDSAVGVGFFFNETPIRQLDPPNHVWKWPEHRGQVHGQGRIIGGALWRLRGLLATKLGSSAGIAHTDHIWYESTRRAVDIPSMYVEALVVDDDDGNLSNGTPNGCEINAAFGPAGLYTADHEGGHERVLPIDHETDFGYPVQLLLSVPVFSGCPVSAAPELEFRTRGEAVSTTVPMAASDGGYRAYADGEPGEVLQYRVRVGYDNGSERSLPDNTIDPWYEHFVGDVVPLYCTSFADGAPDWELGPLWDVGKPSGESLFDPPSARDGSGDVLGIRLEGNGLYLPLTNTRAHSPDIDTRGYPKVRLQYWRWLTVEDGHYDRASILVDDEVVWHNHVTEEEHLATFHHIDQEWRFHDVDLSAHAGGGRVRVGFELIADEGLHYGGWTIDELCVVGVVECGNGIVEEGEECDDGNDVAGDGCSPDCRLEDDGVDPSGGGSGPGGSGPGGDGGDGEDGGPSADDLGLVGRGCACTSEPAGTPAWLPGLFILGLGLARRRRAHA